MNTTQISKQVKIATIQAGGNRKLYSELDSKFVRNGQGVMSQEYFAEELAKRNSPGAY